MGAHLSSLRGQENEQDMWRESLKMLQSSHELPAAEERLFASLRISYDALEDSQKRMFLDTAFFFLGRRITTALSAWEGYGCNATHSQSCFLLILLALRSGRRKLGFGMQSWKYVFFTDRINIVKCIMQVGLFMSQNRSGGAGRLLHGANQRG